MSKSHNYSVKVKWTGNLGTGTSGYRAYERTHQIEGTGKDVIRASSDPAFRGAKDRYNPEELLVASLSSCHMLWYLHLCADAGIKVLDYEDHAEGIMIEEEATGGRFQSVTLKPKVVVAEASMMGTAQNLHHRANELCFIANSCNFKVLHKPQCTALSE